ncbi:NUDIX hydrolase [Geitlerinema splendidum]|jgi:ADP-ribose pyrophosphatase YjhB (NUDIX family)|nr:NUDIX hydrolase [Geitlerinema splendidum]
MSLKHKQTVAALIRKVPALFSIAQTGYRLTRPRFSAGVVGVVINQAGQILIVEHVFHPRTAWGLPGGWVEWNELPSDTLLREMREELALEVEVGPIVALKRGIMMHLDFAYLCRPLGAVGRLSSELLDYRWEAIDSLPRLHPFHRYAVDCAFKTLPQYTWV